MISHLTVCSVEEASYYNERNSAKTKLGLPANYDGLPPREHMRALSLCQTDPETLEDPPASELMLTHFDPQPALEGVSPQAPTPTSPSDPYSAAHCFPHLGVLLSFGAPVSGEAAPSGITSGTLRRPVFWLSAP